MSALMQIRPSDGPLTADELDVMLIGMQERFSWRERADRYDIAGSWRSRTATFYRCRGSSGTPDLMVRLGAGWDPAHASAFHAGIERLSTLLDALAPPVRVVPVAGWNDDPPALCMPYIEGADLLDLLADASHPGWVAPWSPAVAIESCGRALGVFHARTEILPAAGTPAMPSTKATLHTVARSMRVPERLLRRAESATAPSYGDFGPHQFRLSASGELSLLDPPLRAAMIPIHRDLGRFTFGLRKVVGVAAAAKLSRSFFAGYEETGPWGRLIPEDHYLIQMYRGHAARGLAHKRFRSRRIVQAARFTGEWLSLVVALRRSRRDVSDPKRPSEMSSGA